MNNTRHIKAITAAALLLLGTGLPYGVAANEGATQVSQQGSVTDTLTTRQQAIPLIASAMATSNMEKLRDALNRGLDAGLTVNEAKEVLVQLYAYAGFPRSLNALNELMKVVEARKARGISDPLGKEPVTPIPVGDELRRVGTANQTKISGAPVQGRSLSLPQ